MDVEHLHTNILVANLLTDPIAKAHLSVLGVSPLKARNKVFARGDLVWLD